jgi:hypothetical protein
VNAEWGSEITRHWPLVTSLEWLGRFGLRDLRAALLARAARIVIPEVEHRLAEMLHDVAAIEVDVFHHRSAIFAVKDDVLMLSRRTAPLDHHSDRVRRAHGSMRNIRRNEECLPFPNEMIDDAIAFADANFDVAFKLIKILFRIDEMKIVPRVRTFDHHDKKIATVVKIAVAHRRLEEMTVLFDPVLQIYRRSHRRRGISL